MHVGLNTVLTRILDYIANTFENKFLHYELEITYTHKRINYIMLHKLISVYVQYLDLLI